MAGIPAPSACGAGKCIIDGFTDCSRLTHSVATPKEIDTFLAESEKRAFRRIHFHVKDVDAALDIVQDSMIKLVEHYAGKSVQELPMLFQRILTNTMLDWFRRQKTRQALFVNLGDLSADDESDDPQEWLLTGEASEADNPFHTIDGWQQLGILDELIAALPARQREAFLLRYLEELDVAETAALMGCSEGSVKTHSFRAVQALSKQLIQRGMKP